ncbi:MAG: hypothetical protein A2Z95_00125 [Gallionellales bacterium GWA2_60_18]|nr:MAG: hypothetical protein A2Z95_00125 [Gallionellales bacterium GWA2_60_18]
MADLFTSALSGMNAAQIGLATTEHNIANASTPGYTRQEMQIASRPGQQTGFGFVGEGVSVSGIKRIYDEFLTTQVLQEQTQASYLSTYHGVMKQIDNLVADPVAGASAAMQSFFDAMNGVASNPESVPARQTLLGAAQFAANRFQSIDQRLSDIANGLNSQISGSVNTINTLARQIAALNGNIKRATAATDGQQLPNDLMDQRDQLISQLNKEIKVSVQNQSDGTVAVSIGHGQTLVIDEQVSALRVISSSTDPSKLEVAYQNGNKTIALQQSSLQGGNLGAYLAFRDQSLEPARNALGRVALGMAMSVNQQNQLGLDLKGVSGGAIFNVAVPRISVNSSNTGSAGISATIGDVNALTTSDYELRYDGSRYTMIRLSDNAITDLGSPTSFPASFSVDGVNVSLTAGALAGDRFMIRPTANGARDMKVSMSDPSKVATAMPMRTMAALTNTGTGAISSGALNLNPVSITFDNPPTTFTVSDTSTTPPTVLEAGVTYTSGNDISYNGWTAQIAGAAPVAGDSFTLAKDSSAAAMRLTASASNTGNTSISGGALDLQQPFSITFTSPTTYTVSGAVPAVVGAQTYTPGQDISYNGWTVQISGQPFAGDVFNVEINTNAAGDNRNAMSLSALQLQNLMVGGTATLQGAYGQLVGDVGAKTHELDVTSHAQENMLAQTIAAQQSISGVNLDEEAANLMRFQKAYQAAAKAMQIAQTMFDSLMAIGR